MIRRRTVLALALIAAGACSRHNNTPVDTTLNTDLSLAAQQRGYQPLDSVSAAERRERIDHARAGGNGAGCFEHDRESLVIEL